MTRARSFACLAALAIALSACSAAGDLAPSSPVAEPATRSAGSSVSPIARTPRPIGIALYPERPVGGEQFIVAVLGLAPGERVTIVITPSGETNEQRAAIDGIARATFTSSPLRGVREWTVTVRAGAQTLATTTFVQAETIIAATSPSPSLEVVPVPTPITVPATAVPTSSPAGPRAASLIPTTLAPSASARASAIAIPSTFPVPSATASPIITTTPPATPGPTTSLATPVPTTAAIVPTATPSPAAIVCPAPDFILAGETYSISANMLPLPVSLYVIGTNHSMSFSIVWTDPVPVVSATGAIVTDHGSVAVPMSLSSGTPTNGTWSGSGTFSDTICSNFGLDLAATDSAGRSSVNQPRFK